MGVRSTFSLVLSSLALLLLVISAATPWWRYFTQDSDTKGGIHTKIFIDGTCQTKGDLPNTTNPFDPSFPRADSTDSQNRAMRLHRESSLYKNNGPAQVIFDATLGLMIASIASYLLFIHFVFRVRTQSRARLGNGETSSLLSSKQLSYSEQKRNFIKEKAQIRLSRKTNYKHWAVASGVLSLIIVGSALATFSIGLPLKWTWLEGNLFGNKLFRVDADRNDIMGEIARVGLDSGTLIARNHSEPTGKEILLSSGNRMTNDSRLLVFQKKQVVYKLFWGPGAGWFLSIFSALPLAIAIWCVAATASHPIEEDSVESIQSQLEQYNRLVFEQKPQTDNIVPVVTVIPGAEEIRSSISNASVPTESE